MNQYWYRYSVEAWEAPYAYGLTWNRDGVETMGATYLLFETWDEAINYAADHSLDLLDDFGPVARRVTRRGQERDAVTRIVMASVMLCDIAPPVGQRTEGVGRVGRLPVDLRRDVVDGALFQPGQWVTEDAVKLPVTARGARSHTMLTC